MEVQMNQNYKKNYKKSSNQNTEEKKKVTVKCSSKSYMKKPDPNVIKKKNPKSATSTEKETSRYKATKEEVDQIRESVTHTVPVKRKKKTKKRIRMRNTSDRKKRSGQELLKFLKQERKPKRN